MRILLCLDYSPFTEKVLLALQDFIHSLKEYEITVVHVIDETLLYAGTGYEIQLNEELKANSEAIKQSAIKYLGEKVVYREEYGIPRQQIDEVLAEANYDLLVVGRRSKNMLAEMFLGSIATHLLTNCKKPVLVIS
ncbi:MAG: universal stress protein [Flavipsychrobacter sp.]|nr:universal stress protein [Flavipsychrobacter sp.]